MLYSFIFTLKSKLIYFLSYYFNTFIFQLGLIFFLQLSILYFCYFINTYIILIIYPQKIQQFSMQLIQSYLTASNSFLIKKQSISNTFSNFSTLNFGFSNKKLTITSVLEKKQKRQLISRTQVDFQNNCIKNNFNMIQRQCKNNSERNNIQKHFLDWNSKNKHFIYKIDMKSNEINLVQLTYFTLQFRYLNELIQFVQNILFQLKNQITRQFKKISNLFNQNYDCLDQSQKDKLNFFKQFQIYMKSSIYYSWNILSSNTQKSKQNIQGSTYNKTKRFFRKLKKNVKQNKIVKYVTKILNTIEKEEISFFMLTSNEDQELKEKHLYKYRNIYRNSKQVEEICLQDSEIQNIQNNQYVKIKVDGNFVKFGKRVYVKMSDSEMNYEGQILKKLPNEEYVGIPKFYLLKNHDYKLKKIVLPNIFNLKQFDKYLFSNQQTITVKTKINLLLQIVSTLKYLRDQSIVYNHLNPKSIFIKKGLIKFTNFSNSFHPQLIDCKQTPYKNIFPYITIQNDLNYKNYDDERSDVYSFCILIHEVLFGKNYINIKESSFKKLEIQQQQQNQRSNIISIQKYNGLKLGNVLGKLSLMVNNIIDLKNTLESKQKQIKKNIPFLDWMVIMFKFTEQNLILKL